MRKKLLKLVSSLLLCGILSAVFSVGALAEEIEVGTPGELNESIVAEVQPSALDKSEESQSVVVDIEFSKTVVINAISAARVLVPEGWSVVVRGVGYTLESGDTEDHLLSVGYDSGIRMIAGAYTDEESYRHIHGLRLTYSVPAGETGSFALGLEELCLGTISGVTVIDGIDVKVSVEISESGGSDTLLGDVNSDGALDERDAILLLRYVSGLPTDAEENVLDLNKDGEVDHWDALLLFRMVSGQSTEPVRKENASVRQAFVGLYGENGRMVGLCALGKSSSSAELDALLRAAEEMRVFYLDGSFVPVTDSSVISVETR